MPLTPFRFAVLTKHSSENNSPKTRRSAPGRTEGEHPGDEYGLLTSSGLFLAHLCGFRSFNKSGCAETADSGGSILYFPLLSQLRYCIPSSSAGLVS